MRRAAEESLRSITGMDFRRAGEWEPWWRANQEILRNKVQRSYWVRKTQDRVEVTPAEKAPADSILVAARIHSAPAAAAGPPKKKKKGK
jgi:hypothetical protein